MYSKKIEELENENNYNLQNIPRINTCGFVSECKFINLFYKEICFHSFILVNNDNCVPVHSNYFFSDIKTQTFHYNRDLVGNYINSRITYTYSILSNTTSLEKYHIIEEPVFLLFNPFTNSNIGHDLSIMFDKINHYRKNNLDIPLLLPVDYKRNQYIETILNSLLPNHKLYLVEYDTLYFFKKIYVCENELLNITKHIYLIDEIKNYVVQKTENIEKFKNKKILLLKNHSSNNLSTTGLYGNTEEFEKLMIKNHDYIKINVLNFEETILYLLFCKEVITTYGVINYGNSIFLNTNAAKYIIDCEPYYNNLFKVPFKIINLDTFDLVKDYSHIINQMESSSIP